MTKGGFPLIKLILGLAFAFLLTLFLGLSFMAHAGFLLYVSAVLGLACVGTIIYAVAHKPKEPRRVTLSLDDSEASDALEDSFNQGIETFNYIQDTLPIVQDTGMKSQLRDMQDKARRIFQYLEKHPQKVALARRFIDYYQDTTASLLMKYVEIEKTGLRTSEVEEIKLRTKQTLYNLNTAYTEQFAKIVSDQLMDMDAELKVMNDSIAADSYHIQQDMPDFDRTTPGTTDTFDDTPLPRRRRHRHNYTPFTTKITQKLFGIDPPVLKQKLTASVLAIFLGGFGAHKFYLGQTGWGILYLLFCWTFIPGIVGIIEGIRLFCMNGPEFEKKYYRSSHYHSIHQ